LRRQSLLFLNSIALTTIKKNKENKMSGDMGSVPDREILIMIGATSDTPFPGLP